MIIILFMTIFLGSEVFAMEYGLRSKQWRVGEYTLYERDFLLVKQNSKDYVIRFLTQAEYQIIKSCEDESGVLDTFKTLEDRSVHEIFITKNIVVLFGKQIWKNTKPVGNEFKSRYSVKCSRGNDLYSAFLKSHDPVDQWCFFGASFFMIWLLSRGEVRDGYVDDLISRSCLDSQFFTVVEFVRKELSVSKEFDSIDDSIIRKAQRDYPFLILAFDCSEVTIVPSQPEAPLAKVLDVSADVQARLKEVRLRQAVCDDSPLFLPANNAGLGRPRDPSVGGSGSSSGSL